MIIDTHAHLNSDKYDEDLDNVIKNALECKVERMIVVGYNLEGNQRAIELSEKYDFIYAAIGLHPVDVYKETEETKEFIINNINNKKIVAIGETGLDYYHSKEHIELQKEVFKWHIEISLKYNKPLIIHARDSLNDSLNILKEYNNLSGVMHCYSGSVEMAKEFEKIGLYISLAGPVTFKNAKEPKEVAISISEDRLLVETDCPYLTPTPYRGKRNEPAYITNIVNEIASLRGISYEEASKITTNNAIRLFNLK